jgi:hypothetical protein
MLGFVAHIGVFYSIAYMWVRLHALGLLQNEEIVDKLSIHIYSAAQAFGKALPRPGLTVLAILLALDLDRVLAFLVLVGCRSRSGDTPLWQLFRHIWLDVASVDITPTKVDVR